MKTGERRNLWGERRVVILEKMLKFLVALALVIVSVQCAAACTPVASAQPSCHHHKQAPACAHELVPATIVQTSAMDLSFSAAALPVPMVTQTVASRHVSTLENPSPPLAGVPRLTVLRI
jgi:hypothetical protein